jgi:hypothetical protein
LCVNIYFWLIHFHKTHHQYVTSQYDMRNTGTHTWHYRNNLMSSVDCVFYLFFLFRSLGKDGRLDREVPQSDNWAPWHSHQWVSLLKQFILPYGTSVNVLFYNTVKPAKRGHLGDLDRLTEPDTLGT